MDRKQIEKILAVALNPGAYEEEAVAALGRAREIVKKNPHLAHPEPPPPPANHRAHHRLSLNTLSNTK